MSVAEFAVDVGGDFAASPVVVAVADYDDALPL